MTEPDPKTVREIARKHIRSGRTDIGTTVALHFGRGVLSYEEFAAWEYDVHKAWRVELRAVEWPDEQQPADVVTAEQQQDGAVGPDLTYRVTQAYRAARFMRLDDDALIQGIVTAVLAERTALAARVAELESERDEARARLAELGEPETQLRIIGPSGAAYTPTGLDLQHRSDWVPGVRLEERQVYPTPWHVVYPVCRSCGTTKRVLGDPPLCSNCAVRGPTYRGVACWPPIAAPEARSEPVERSETSGGIGTASNSSTGTAGLSAACGNKYSYHVCFLPAGHDGDHRDDRYWRWPTHLGTWTSDDTTEDGQHG